MATFSDVAVVLDGVHDLPIEIGEVMNGRVAAGLARSPLLAELIVDRLAAAVPTHIVGVRIHPKKPDQRVKLQHEMEY